MKLPIMAPMQECAKCIAQGTPCPRHAELEEKKNDRYYKKIMSTKPSDQNIGGIVRKTQWKHVI